jgi:AcrR family transcriptional regulator
VSIGSLYQYFRNKGDVLDELRARHGDWFEREMREGIERGAALPLREGVRASISRMVDLHRVDPPLHRAVSATRQPLSSEELAEFRGRTAEYLRANASQLRPVDPELAAVIITRATEALVHGLSLDEPEWLEHPGLVDEVTELIVGYLAPRS